MKTILENKEDMQADLVKITASIAKEGSKMRTLTDATDMLSTVEEQIAMGEPLPYNSGYADYEAKLKAAQRDLKMATTGLFNLGSKKTQAIAYQFYIDHAEEIGA